MKYNELIQFEPIETIVQLRDADKVSSAKNLVSTYVVSDDMKERINTAIIPNLQFNTPADNKGLLIVGNYGTGKSHLMSVISAIAQETALLESLTNPGVVEASKEIAGKFKVIRSVIGASTMSLRDILVAELEEGLSAQGVSYTFPDTSKITSHKKPLDDMMKAFQSSFPDHGLLLVVDELLDFLRTRKDQELILDLNFLREIGEYCTGSRFRFISGVQEAIFDSPRFAFVADQLRRVKDRFVQVSIARKDVKYVVSERLLRKNAEQETKIRKHLLSFTKFYGNMNEKIDEFVRLFPIHPDYIETFEKVTVIEKREILKAISQVIKSLIDKPVPENEPGVIAYDNYWNTLKLNPSFRAIPEVKEVLNCSSTLEDRINLAFTRPVYKPMALRLIYGLSVHRLTTSNIYAPIGATPEELRDSLVLYDSNIEELGGTEPEKDLLTLVETVLKEIHKTVSGQFISSNTDNRQYFLDLKKVDDFDAIIERKAESLDENVLDRYYFDALKQVLELTDLSTHVSGYNIWQHELTWKEKNAARTGYLFFGAPNQRSTAVPQRDFYIYFIQPFDPPRYKDELKSDEVFIKIKKYDDEFKTALANFAAASDLASTSSGPAKSAYENKSRTYVRSIVLWIQKHIIDVFELTHQGKSKLLPEWAKGKSIRDLAGASGHETLSTRDLINVISALCLSTHFKDIAPEYPSFSILITGANRGQAASEAIRAITGFTRTKQAVAVLDALKLMDGNRIIASSSPYLKLLIEKLKSKALGQVLNRSEIFQDDFGLEYLDVGGARLEPEWVVVLIAAAVYNGDVVLAITGNKFDASNLSQLSSMSIDQLINFKHLEQPKDWNTAGIKALLDFLGLAPGLLNQITQNDDTPVQLIQSKIEGLVSSLVTTKQVIKEGIIFWGIDILQPANFAARLENLEKSKEFLESLQVFTTSGKLKNFHYSPDQITSHNSSVSLIDEIAEINDFAHNNSVSTSWLSQAESILPVSHPLVDQLQAYRKDLINEVANTKPGSYKKLSETVGKKLSQFKSEYKKTYLNFHTLARLGLNEDKRKAAILSSSTLDSLRRLSVIDILPKQQLSDLTNTLASLMTCFSLTEKELDLKPECTHCHYRPSSETPGKPVKNMIDAIDSRIEDMLRQWTKALIENLSDPATHENIALLKQKDRKVIDSFISEKELPSALTNEFIDSLKEVLSGLIKISVNIIDLQKALKISGGPVTVEELKKRFEDYLSGLSKGKDASKVRIIFE